MYLEPFCFCPTQLSLSTSKCHISCLFCLLIFLIIPSLCLACLPVLTASTGTTVCSDAPHVSNKKVFVWNIYPFLWKVSFVGSEWTGVIMGLHTALLNIICAAICVELDSRVVMLVIFEYSALDVIVVTWLVVRIRRNCQMWKGGGQKGYQFIGLHLSSLHR